MRVLREERGDVGEGVRVAGVVGEDEGVCQGEFGRVFEHGRLELAEFLQDQVDLLSPWEFDRVYGCAGFDGGVVGGAVGAGEEGVEEGGFATAGGAEEVGEEDGAVSFGGFFGGGAGAGLG